MSLYLAYRDARTREDLAWVHQYQLPGGGIGASGRPDPKRLFEHGKIYVEEDQ